MLRTECWGDKGQPLASFRQVDKIFLQLTSSEAPIAFDYCITAIAVNGTARTSERERQLRRQPRRDRRQRQAGRRDGRLRLGSPAARAPRSARRRPCNDSGCFRNTQGRLCAKGTIAPLACTGEGTPLLSCDWMSNWGAMIGLNREPGARPVGRGRAGGGGGHVRGPAGPATTCWPTSPAIPTPRTTAWTATSPGRWSKPASSRRSAGQVAARRCAGSRTSTRSAFTSSPRRPRSRSTSASRTSSCAEVRPARARAALRESALQRRMIHARRFVTPAAVHPLRRRPSPAAAAACAAGDGRGRGRATTDGAVPLLAEDQAFLANFCHGRRPLLHHERPDRRRRRLASSPIAKLPQTRDPAVRRPALDQLRQLATSRLCLPDFAELDEPCVRVFDEPSGSRAPGEACTTAKGLHGQPGNRSQTASGPASPTRWARRTTIPVLAACTWTGRSTTSPGRPARTSPRATASCASLRAGLYCDWNDNFRKPLRPGGGACTQSLNCASRACADRPTPRLRPVAGPRRRVRPPTARATAFSR